MNDDWWDFIWPGYGVGELRFIKGGAVQQFWWLEERSGLVSQFDDDGWDCYYGVIPRKDVGGSKAEDCWPTTTVLWADVDAKDYCPTPKCEEWNCGGHKEWALDTILRFPIAPSAIIDSGHGYHVYHRLAEPVAFADAQYVMKGIAKWVRGDSTYDQPRILRVPGTQNCKDPNNPLPVRILKLDTLKRYSLSDFDEVVQCLQEPFGASTPARSLQGGRREDADQWLKDFLDTEPPVGSRSEALFKAVKSLDRLGYEFDEILTVVMNSPVGAKAQERGERWAERDIERSLRKA